MPPAPYGPWKDDVMILEYLQRTVGFSWADNPDKLALIPVLNYALADQGLFEVRDLFLPDVTRPHIDAIFSAAIGAEEALSMIRFFLAHLGPVGSPHLPPLPPLPVMSSSWHVHLHHLRFYEESGDDERGNGTASDVEVSEPPPPPPQPPKVS